MESLFKELRNELQGEVKCDDISKKAYSVDASIYEIVPLGIVLPKSVEDIIRTIKIASRYGVSIIARGAATGITGGCLGQGLIIDTSKYLNKILEINYDEGYAICEPGVVQDQLNQALSARGFRLGPDTSTGNRATLGGMLANNSAGARSLRYGKMVDNVLEVELALANGELIYFKELASKELEAKLQLNSTEGTIYREIENIKKEYADEIDLKFPKIPRRVSGYNLDELIQPQPLNVSKLIAGSEGSLGIATKIKMRIAPKPKATSLCLIQFKNMVDGMSVVGDILPTQPISLEVIDDQILEAARLSPSLKAKIAWIQDEPACIIVAEYEGDTTEEASSQSQHLSTFLQGKNKGYNHLILSDPVAMAQVWEVRKAGLGLLLSKRSYSRAIAFIEDLSLPPLKLASFMSRFTEYLKSNGKQAGIYGHAGSGCIHIRPYVNLKEKSERELMYRMMLEVSDMVLEFGGTLSGEHGDGIIRTWLNQKMFGDKVYAAFKKLKYAFDPAGLMNPGKVVDGFKPLENLRSTLEPMQKVPTFLNFDPEGGFELATDLCNGNGLCRKKEGLMCPSFQATNDEYNTTRARAQALRSIVNGKLPVDAMTSDEVQEVLDLCLECKGCKTDCPSQVDMAKMKSEVLFQYQEKHGYFLRHRLFAHIPVFLKLGSYFPKLYKWVSNRKIFKSILNTLGVSPQRSLPPVTTETFSEWLRKNPQNNQFKQSVVLFNDTYSEFVEPSVGIAAVKVLNAMEFNVIVPKWKCCGRPYISKGLLKQAKKQVLSIYTTLLPYIEKKIPIIGLEPSCISTLSDDLIGLLGKEFDPVPLRNFMSQCKTFDQFIADNISKLTPILKPKESCPKTLLHVHCHQKSLTGSKSTLQTLSAIPGLNYSEINSGCCGLAGSFGYEKEHYDLSIAIANLKLAPTINSEPDATVVANGLSCRYQIKHTTGKKAKHLAEYLTEFLNCKG